MKCDLCGDDECRYADITYLRVRGIDINACDTCLEAGLVEQCDACSEWVADEEAYPCGAQILCAWCAYETEEGKEPDWPKTVEEVHARIKKSVEWVEKAVEESRHA